MTEYKDGRSKRNSRRWSRVALCCIGMLVIVALLIGIIILAIEKDKTPTMCTTPHCVMIALFERPISQDDIDAMVKVKRYYASCMDLDTIVARDAQPLLQLLHDHGGFPVLGDKFGGRWNETDFDMETLLGRLLHRMYSRWGASIIIGTVVKIDEKNSIRHITYVDQPAFSMKSRDYYVEEQHSWRRKAYLDYMIAITTMLGANETIATRDMTDVLELEIKLANLSTPRSERRYVDDRYHLTTLANLTQDVPELNWVKYFDVVMPEENKPFPSTEEIVNNSPNYISEAVKLLKEETQPRVVANYIMWRLTATKIPHLSDRFIDEKRKLDKAFTGTLSTKPRFVGCISAVNKALQFATGRMYVAEYLAGESKANVEELIARLKKAFESMLEYNDWMDGETKMAAIEKIEFMREKIGYPDWILDDDLLNDYYKKFIVEGNNYFENSLRKSRFMIRNMLTSLRRPVDKEWWTPYEGPAVVNAFYNSGRNSMVFPAAILQPPFYHKESPWYLNYGGVGFLIGHELTHGFDDNAGQNCPYLWIRRKKDKDGNAKQWWTVESSENFNDRAQCVVNQYNQYVVPEINKTLNGFQTQGENIADIGGIKEAYTAYKDSNHIDVKMPGFENFTSEQMLFLNKAQVGKTAKQCAPPTTLRLLKQAIS